MGAYRLTRKADADLAGLYRYGIQNFGIERADSANIFCAGLGIQSLGKAPTSSDFIGTGFRAKHT